jgi:homoserine O-acetyltransferase/O-succinyltransferase
VLALQGTGGSGAGFLTESFAGQLFGPGRLLDAAQYFIVLPDGVGHGQSSKPSDGLRLRFPRYTYDDMIETRGHGTHSLPAIWGSHLEAFLQEQAVGALAVR